MIRIGIIGKTNTGKTTFFNAATSSTGEVSTYPFTTKKQNTATGQVQTLCVCRELGVTDKPRNSTCIDGWRFIPIEVIDLPGLIKGAFEGKGLGTQFLNVVSQADALLHVVDASGGIDEEGKITHPGMGNPVIDVYDIEEEMILWFKVAIDRALQRTKKKTLKADSFDKPISNKMDLAYAEKNFEKLREEFKSQLVIPVCSEAEVALKRAEGKGFIQYVPGEETFKVIDESRLTKDQAWALAYVQQKVMTKWMRTGVQFALNAAIFKLLGMNAVYPVEDPKGLSDKRGNILPDVYLVPKGYVAKDLAREIHSELAAKMLHAIDARNGLRLPQDYELRDRDVISIVTAARKK